MTPAEFVYRLPTSTTGNRPGSHRSRSRGAGMNFVAHARLLDQPDPRRLDLRASLADLRREWQVRVNQHRASIDICAIVDVSHNMHFGSAGTKLSVAAQFINALGFSAGAYGDAVSMLAFDSIYREDLTVPSRQGRGVGSIMAELVSTSVPSANCAGAANASALSHCVAEASARAKLVFICSDFHWSLDDLAKRLDPLAGAQVVPIVIWDCAEIKPPDSGRWLSLRQIGTWRAKHLWLNDSARQQWSDNVARRKDEIINAFAAIDAVPFFISDGFDAEALSRYFMEHSA